MLEYITSFYFIALLATIIGLTTIYIYDKFEKKQYTGANYFRFAILIYISTFIALYLISTIAGKLGNGGTGLLSGGGNSDAAAVSTMNDYSKMHLEQFKTGIPTF